MERDKTEKKSESILVIPKNVHFKPNSLSFLKFNLDSMDKTPRIEPSMTLDLANKLQIKKNKQKTKMNKAK